MSKVFTISDADKNVLVNNEKIVKDKRAENSDNNSAINTAKISNYAVLISGLANVESGALNNKGLLKPDVRKVFNDLLSDDLGFGKADSAVCKKYRENSAKAVRFFKIDKSHNMTPEEVLNILEENEITSESKLAKTVDGKKDLSDIEKVVASLIGSHSRVKDENTGDWVSGDKWKRGKFGKSIEGAVDCKISSKEYDKELDVLKGELILALDNAIQIDKDNYKKEKEQADSSANSQQDNDNAKDVADKVADAMHI